VTTGVWAVSGGTCANAPLARNNVLTNAKTANNREQAVKVSLEVCIRL